MDFIKSSISLEVRLDGRRLDEQYELNIVPGISAISHGSSQVSFGDNVVQTTVNFSIVSPEDSAPDEGIIELNVCGTNVFDNSELSQKNDEFLCNILYDTQFKNDFLDLRSLCILPGHFCWNLRIHSTIIKRGGSTLDALSIGVLTALRCSQVPGVELMLIDEMENIFQTSNLQVKLSSEKNPFIENLTDNLPLVISVGKIGDKFVWGLTKEEESCCEGTLSVAVDRNGNCLSVSSTGSCFDIKSITGLISKSSKMAHSNFSKIDQFLN